MDCFLKYFIELTQLIFFTVSMILGAFWFCYSTVENRDMYIASIAEPEGSFQLVFQHSCFMHGNAEVPHTLGFDSQYFVGRLKNCFFLWFYRTWGSFVVLPLREKARIKAMVIFPLNSVTFLRWFFLFLVSNAVLLWEASNSNFCFTNFFSLFSVQKIATSENAYSNPIY